MKKDKESTLEQEEMLRQIVNNIDGAFWLMSADKKEMLYLSSNFERIFDRPRVGIMGNMEAYLDLIHEEDREASTKAYTEFLKTGNYAEEYRIKRPDGTIRWVHSTAFPVKNEQGNIIRYAGIIQDITGKKTSEIESKEKTERLNAVLGAIPDMFFVLDKDGVFQDVIATNPHKLIIPIDQVIGKSLHDIFSPEEAQMHLGYYEKCLREKKLTVFDYHITMNDQTMFFEARLNPVDDNTVLSIVRDITDSKRLQESYKQELDFRQFLFQSNKDGLVIVNNDHKVVDSNIAFCEMLGYSIDEIKALHTWDFDALATEEDIRSGIDTTIDVDATFESKHRRKDGTVYDVEISARSFNWKGERLVICTCRDISDRKRMERETLEAKSIAEANQRRFEEITEYTGEFIWEVDKNGIYTYANSAVERMLGYKPEELLQKIKCWELLPKKDRKKYQKAVLEVFASKEPLSNLENVMISKSGQLVYAITNGIPVLDADGKLIGYRGSDRDVTDQKIAEEKAEESSRLKTAFIDNISHEIRTPLNGIIGFGQLIAQSNITGDERMGYFKNLQKSTDRLIQTVTDFMDISKIASGNMNVNTRKFMIGNILNEQYERISGLCAAKGIDLRLDVPQEAGDLVMKTDDELLRKALGHLLDNAVKFSEKGTITFGYRLKDQSVSFFVRDQGKGIAKEKLEKIFEPFIQEDLRMTRGYEGSGLGLAIIQGIAKLLGGKVWARSEKAKGSEFFLSLPYEGKQETGAGIPSGVHTKQAIENPVILVAEDDESNFVLIEIILKKAGYEVLHAKNGQEAVDLCEANQEIHLVLMDIKMPVMNGLDATRHIKGFRADLPVVAVTAYLRSGDEHLIKDAGCEEFCQKPFTRESLLKTVGRYVGKTVEG